MRKLHIFLFILTITLAVLVTLALVSWYFAASAPTYYGSSWMGQMWGNHLGTSGNNWGMGGMIGDGTYGNGVGTTPSYLWIIPITLIGIVAVAIIGVGFYLYFPELRYVRSRGSCNPQTAEPVISQTKATEATTTNSTSPVFGSFPATPLPVSPQNNCEVLLKTMTPEEQKVMNVLVSHQGKYLQKYVGKEAGLSRLKTHRIVARFAQRGIVTVKEFGNTNEIIISDWVRNSSPIH
jgi:uncharacterized membrane protein